MNSYEVRRITDDSGPRTAGTVTKEVTADSFEIQDGGVLVFKEVRDDAPTIGDVARDRKKFAFNDWSEVERV